MTLLSTIAAFLITLGILIVVHEYGHYWVARKCGVKVLRFSIGFGRPIKRWVRGEDRTEWVIAAMPLGGYVRMLDERDPDCAPVAAADLPRSFNRQSVWKRIAIVLAGPAANLLLAIAVYWLLNVVGVMEPQALLGSPPSATAASRAGVAAGDRVVEVDGEPVRSWNELRWVLLQRAVGTRPIELEVEGTDASRRIVSLDAAGAVAGDLDGDVIARLGIVPYSGSPRVGRVAEESAAARAGLLAGDRIVAAGGEAIDSARALIERVRASAEKPLELTVEREGQPVRILVT